MVKNYMYHGIAEACSTDVSYNVKHEFVNRYLCTHNLHASLELQYRSSVGNLGPRDYNNEPCDRNDVFWVIAGEYG